MKKEQKKPTLTITYMAVSALWRLIPHWPNMTPFTALALFSGSQHQSHWSLLAPLIPLVATDLFFGLHATIPFVYGSMILISLLGRRLHKKSPLSLAGATVASSLLFFIITNFGAWLTSGLYPQTLGGIVTAFTLAIPFYQNAVIGDLAFSLIFFGCMGLIKMRMAGRIAGSLLGSTYGPTLVKQIKKSC